MTCAFEPCAPDTCPLAGGCVRQRFPGHFLPKPAVSELKKNAPALNGTLPGRTNRDPRFIKRKRKALQ